MSKYEEKMSPKELVEFFSKNSSSLISIIIFDLLLWFVSLVLSFSIYGFSDDYFPKGIFTTLTEKERFLFYYLLLGHILLISLLLFKLFRLIITDCFELFKLFDKKNQDK